MAQTLIYRIEVYAKQPLVDSEAESEATAYEFPTLARATDPVYKRDIEKMLIACLRRFELDCDVELMDFTVEDE